MTVCPHCGCELRPVKRRRSNPQNRFYWAVCVKLLAEHCGYTSQEMHEALKARFLGVDDPQFGLRKIGSTATLTTAEFGDLIAHCQQLGSSLGVYIPDPNEVDLSAWEAA